MRGRCSLCPAFWVHPHRIWTCWNGRNIVHSPHRRECRQFPEGMVSGPTVAERLEEEARFLRMVVQALGRSAACDTADPAVAFLGLVEGRATGRSGEMCRIGPPRSKGCRLHT